MLTHVSYVSADIRLLFGCVRSSPVVLVAQAMTDPKRDSARYQKKLANNKRRYNEGAAKVAKKRGSVKLLLMQEKQKWERMHRAEMEKVKCHANKLYREAGVYRANASLFRRELDSKKYKEAKLLGALDKKEKKNTQLTAALQKALQRVEETEADLSVARREASSNAVFKRRVLAKVNDKEAKRLLRLAETDPKRMSWDWGN